MYVDISTNPLRSPKVLELATAAPLKLTAQQEVAEALLGITSDMASRFNTTQASRASHAVTLQVNMQVESDLDPFIVSSQTSTAQSESVTYRGDAIHPQALEIIQVLQREVAAGNSTAAAFDAIGPIRSARTAGGGGDATWQTPRRDQL